MYRTLPEHHFCYQQKRSTITSVFSWNKFYQRPTIYILTKSAKINFHSIQVCTGRIKVELKKGLAISKQTFKPRGFNITQYHGNNKFDKIIPHLLPSTLNICAEDEHIRGIDCESCTFKDKVRCSCHSTTYKRFTYLMTNAVIKDEI